MYRVRLDIKADVLVHIDEICGLYHPLDAADIDDYLIVYAEECDGGHDALEHSLFLGNNVHVLGADNDVNVLALFKAGVHAVKGVTGEIDLVVGEHHTVEDVALADEIGNKSVLRLVVYVDRRADLLDAAFGHDDNGVGHRERLFLIVRNEHEGDAHGLLDLLQLLLHVLAQLEVERGERLVQQQDFRAADERAGYGDALLLTAGKTGDAAVLKAGERDHAEHLVDALIYLVPRDFLLAQRESDVLKNVEMGEQGVALENGVDVALIRRQLVYILAHEDDVALVGGGEAADETERGGLAAAGRAKQREKFVVVDIKIDMIQHDLAVKGLCDVFQLDDFFHGSAPKIKKVTHALRHTSLEKPIIPGTQPEYIKPLLV